MLRVLRSFESTVAPAANAVLPASGPAHSLKTRDSASAGTAAPGRDAEPERSQARAVRARHPQAWTPTLWSPAAARTACHRSRRVNRHPSSTPVARSSRSGSTSTAHCTVPRACQTCPSPCARALTAPRCRGRVALRRPEHISYLLAGLGSLNSNYSSLDASRPWLAEPTLSLSLSLTLVPNPNPNPNPNQKISMTCQDPRSSTHALAPQSP